MNQRLKRYIKDIAKLHGCKITFVNDAGGGRYWKNKIWVGIKTTDRELISTFCHELAHHKNTIEGKHGIYHSTDYSSDGVKKYGINRYADIMLKAEVYTEKVGKEICKIWFPGVKYDVAYKNDEYWRGWTRGYCFSMLD